MPDEPIIVYSTSVGQDLNDQLKQNGRPIDSDTIASVEFNMRFAETDVLKVTSGSVTVTPSGNVSYSWGATDVDDPGEYYGWWHIELDNSDEIDTSEFLVIVGQHAPGIRVRTGAIYQCAQSEISDTWKALEQSPRHGDAYLQRKIEVCKLRVLGALNVPAEDEYTLDIRVQDFLGKLAALEVIPPAWDYWKDQHETITTGGGGTTEIASYPDRIAALTKIYERLLGEVAAAKGEIEVILGVGPILPTGALPTTSDGIDEGYITPLPVKHFRDYAFPGTTDPFGNPPWNIP